MRPDPDKNERSRVRVFVRSGQGAAVSVECRLSGPPDILISAASGPEHRARTVRALGNDRSVAAGPSRS
jgi:hypothetical protein